MTPPGHRIDHPHVSRHPDLASGSPVIAGTKFPVRLVVEYVLKRGMVPEELVREFPQLSLSFIYDALSYYYDHQSELEREMEENTEAHWRGGAS
jgi:uncharacterized protein (DUF433 family)